MESKQDEAYPGLYPVKHTHPFEQDLLWQWAHLVIFELILIAKYHLYSLAALLPNYPNPGTHYLSQKQVVSFNSLGKSGFHLWIKVYKLIPIIIIYQKERVEGC